MTRSRVWWNAARAGSREARDLRASIGAIEPERGTGEREGSFRVKARPRRSAMSGGGRKSTEVEDDCDKRKRRELALDDALENTFPASDPISIVQPAPPAADRDSG